LLVDATLAFATCMLTESSLSYLGFGISPPTPTWGNMLTGANNSIVIQQYWWQWVFVSIIFGVCTICINLVGDAIRDAVDPKSLGR
jgi:peptide/nickel transport system permease protein